MRVSETLALSFAEDKDYIYRWVNSSTPGRVMELSMVGYEPIDPFTGEPVEALEESGEWPARVFRGDMLLMRANAEDRAGKSDHPKAQAIVDEKVMEQQGPQPDEKELIDQRLAREKSHQETWEKVQKATEEQEKNPTARQTKEKQKVEPKPDSKPLATTRPPNVISQTNPTGPVPTGSKPGEVKRG